MIKNIILKTIFFTSIFSAQLFAQSIPNKLFKKPNEPVVDVSGFVNFVAANRMQEENYEQKYLPDGSKNHYSRQMSVGNNSQIYFKVGAISDSGVKYGAIVEVDGNISTDANLNQLRLDKGFIFSETQFGKFEVGNNNGANQKMKVGPSIFARATGGVNGRYLQHINFAMLANSPASVCAGGVANANCANVKLPRFIVVAQSPIAHGGYAKGFYNRANDNNYAVDQNGNVDYNRGNSKRAVLAGYNNGSFNEMESATKLSYYTPRIDGMQFGASFTPDTANNGIASPSAAAVSGGVDNVVSFGLNYVGNIENIGFALSATGEDGVFSKSKIHNNDANLQTGRNRLASYDFGAMFTYFGFTIGGSYGYWGKSLQPKSGIYSCDYDASKSLNNQNCSDNSNKFKTAQYYSTGVAYEFGHFAASITNFSSIFQNNKYQATSFGVDYKLRRGIMPYIELTKFKFNSNKVQASDVSDNSQLLDNKGFVVLSGVLFAF